MIDTVKVQSSSISEALARDLEHRLDVKSSLSGVDFETGERSVLYELHSGQVRDERNLHGVNLRIMRTRIVKDLDAFAIGASRTKTVACKPYLWMEGSVHKAMLDTTSSAVLSNSLPRSRGWSLMYPRGSAWSFPATIRGT